MTFKITYSVLDADMTELNREFDAALAHIKNNLGQTFPSWIDGQPVESGDLLLSRAPFDDRMLLARFHRAPVSEIERAVKAAKAAQKLWAKLHWTERVAKIRKAAELISERRLILAAIMSLEVGKSRLESLGDIEESADLLRYYSSQVEESKGLTHSLGKLSPNEDTRDLLRPYGLFAVISPFNFPAALATGMAGAALLAGNAVILKPSEETPWVGQTLYEVLRDAGLPSGIFQLLHGEGHSVGSALVHHPGIDGVAFTGSTKVGFELQHLMTSTKRMRPALLEMGGKNAAIICESADLEAAVEGCARSAFGLAGQKCSALSRIYVHTNIYDIFLEKLIARTRKFVIGDPTQAATYLGPVINKAAVARYEKAAAEAREAGTVHLGGQTMLAGGFEHGNFVTPTIATVPRDHRIAREELFLPFVVIDKFETLDEAIALANDVDYGLTGGIFSGKKEEIEEYMDRAEAGVLYANRKTGATTGAWPGVQSFCGWKGSGSTGKGGCGPFYVAQFAREQSQTRMG